MATRIMKYEDKFVAFVDILGFKAIVEESVINDDARSVALMIERLGSKQDNNFFREDGAEICPCSERHSADLEMRISQVSDCVVVSAEVSPTGAINIVNFCRKVAERLLLREGVLCQGYLTLGKIVHEGTVFFGTGYQAAVDGERTAAGIEWEGEVLGTPFIEIDPVVTSYLDAYGDDCTREMWSRMVVLSGADALISPYGIFGRLADWASDLSKSPEKRLGEFDSARKTIDRVEGRLRASKPSNPRAKEKLRIAMGELSKARKRISEAEHMCTDLEKPFPAR